MEIGIEKQKKSILDEFELPSLRRLAGDSQRAGARDELSGVRGCLKQRLHPPKSGSPNTTTPCNFII
jgi:hypothetical protein